MTGSADLVVQVEAASPINMFGRANVLRVNPVNRPGDGATMQRPFTWRVRCQLYFF